ncbi:hypothetical protein F0562_025134 [Nyssa sinensis]|uniref:Uncharacterized protein n=1 Tax=Nyssa sinensis TaxID=561372 RepID=A0A5J5BEY7_9ASTE|nr:hypothetical protein F0562_025134 [Nyssa sinensis]
MTTLAAKVIVEFAASGRLSTGRNNGKNNIEAWRVEDCRELVQKRVNWSREASGREPVQVDQLVALDDVAVNVGVEHSQRLTDDVGVDGADDVVDDVWAHESMKPVIKLKLCRKGSQWFEMDRDLAVEVITDPKYFPIFERYCKPPCYSDEHYLCTLVSMRFWERNSNRSLTWVDWSKAGPHHPTRFYRTEVTIELLKKMRRGSYPPMRSGAGRRAGLRMLIRLNGVSSSYAYN